MPLYYFDLLDDVSFVSDSEGTEIRDLSAVQNEAAKTISGLAWDAMRSEGALGQHMSLRVRDANGPVMDVKFSFEISRKQ